MPISPPACSTNCAPLPAMASASVRDSYGAGENTALDLVEAAARAHGLATERDAAPTWLSPCPAPTRRCPSWPAARTSIPCRKAATTTAPPGWSPGCWRWSASAPRRLRPAPHRPAVWPARRGKRRVRPRLHRLLGAVRAIDCRTTWRCRTPSPAVPERLHPRRRRRHRPHRGGRTLLDPASVAAWLELHIEQGPVLVARELPVAAVTGIRGNVRHRSDRLPRRGRPFRRRPALAAPRRGVRHRRVADPHRKSLAVLLGQGQRSGDDDRHHRHRPGGARHRPHPRQGALLLRRPEPVARDAGRLPRPVRGRMPPYRGDARRALRAWTAGWTPRPP